jgi:hypothetical protein
MPMAGETNGPAACSDFSPIRSVKTEVRAGAYRLGRRLATEIQANERYVPPACPRWRWRPS